VIKTAARAIYTVIETPIFLNSNYLLRSDPGSPNLVVLAATPPWLASAVPTVAALPVVASSGRAAITPSVKALPALVCLSAPATKSSQWGQDRIIDRFMINGDIRNMVRFCRILVAGGWHHITSLGNENRVADRENVNSKVLTPLPYRDRLQLAYPWPSRFRLLSTFVPSSCLPKGHALCAYIFNSVYSLSTIWFWHYCFGVFQRNHNVRCDSK
jgi:hypothetical protein